MRPWSHYFIFLVSLFILRLKRKSARNNNFYARKNTRTRNIWLNRFCIQSFLTHITTRSLIDCKIVGYSSKMDVYPMITLPNLLNISPINVLVKKSPNIKCVGKYSTFILLLSILYFTTKYLICICLEFPVHELRPFFSIRIAIWLSW